MKAARFYSLDEPLVVEEIEDPIVRPGSVLIRVQAVFVPPFIGNVLNGSLPLTLPPIPFTPGFDTVGIVEELGAGVGGLRVGDAVYCNHAYASSAELRADDMCFIGNFGHEENSINLLREWPNGSYAERVVLPAQCIAPLGHVARFAPALLCRLGWIATAYAALTNAGLRPGHTVVVNGATGLVGTSAVLLALTLGARRIVAVGRNKEVLGTLKELAPGCIETVCLDEQRDSTQTIIDASGGGSDIVVDAASAPTSDSAMSAFASLRRGGAMALVSDSSLILPIPYMTVVDRGISIVGTTWFPHSATAELIGLIDSGTLDITSFEATTYPLEQVNDAIASAATGRRGLHHVALVV